MFITDDKPKTMNSDTPSTTDFDTWTDWKPVWNPDEKRSPHDFQEEHSPTTAVTQRISNTREVQHSRRRILDVRLWDNLRPAQQDAAIEINLAYNTLARGLGYMTADWTRIPGCAGPDNIAETQARLVTDYIAWTKDCHKNKISHAMILDVLIFGHALKQCDRDRRQRKGTARNNLLDGLSLYCLLQGWHI